MGDLRHIWSDDRKTWISGIVFGVRISDKDTWMAMGRLYSRGRYDLCASVINGYAQRYMAGEAQENAFRVCEGLRAMQPHGNNSPMNILDGPEYADDSPKVEGLPKVWLKKADVPARTTVEEFYGRQELEA